VENSDHAITVGDQVRIKRGTCFYGPFSHLIGRIGTVTLYSPGGNCFQSLAIVCFDDGKEFAFFENEDEMEYVAKRIRFTIRLLRLLKSFLNLGSSLARSSKVLKLTERFKEWLEHLGERRVAGTCDLVTNCYRLLHSTWLLGPDAQDAPDDYTDPVTPDYVAAGAGPASGSPAAATALGSEMARVQISTKQVRELGVVVRYGAKFPKGVASGTWTEIGLFNADEIARMVNGCDSETGWSYGANDGSLELTDYREGSAALEAEGSDETPRFQNTTLRAPTGDEDRFTDGTIGAYWSKLEVATGEVTEQNGRLECACPANGDFAGVVTASAHDLTTSEICITVDQANCENRAIIISLTKVTSSDPYTENDLYFIGKRKDTSTIYVSKQVGGAPTELHNAGWSAATGQLRIRISGGNIYFYEDDMQLCTEAYALSSYNCYIYLYCKALLDHTGTDRIDDYVTSLTPVITTSAWLQLFYYVDDTDSLDGNLRIKIGNDAANYWQFNTAHGDVAKGWQWLSFRISAYDSKVGSPALNQLIDYFVLDYDTSLLASLLDRIDFIRLFLENGDMYCRGEFSVGSPKGLNEARHIIWRLRVLGN